ncbi:MAG TPA: hypothetical protein VKZ85_03335 [Woeseiaceae bacterium]|nr:hypothetical protein [Woeseiaceae bacterium]
MQSNKAILYEARHPILVWQTGQAIAKGAPGVISHVSFTAAGGNGTLTLYDGENNTGDVIAEIAAPADTTFATGYPRGVLFKTGVYAEVTNGSAVIVASRA